LEVVVVSSYANLSLYLFHIAAVSLSFEDYSSTVVINQILV